MDPLLDISSASGSNKTNTSDFYYGFFVPETGALIYEYSKVLWNYLIGLLESEKDKRYKFFKNGQLK